MHSRYEEFDSPHRVSIVGLWSLRLLALAGLGVGGFLLYVHIAPWLTDTPFCSLFTWLDCDAVINHPRWSKWFGVPVSAPAVALYAVVAIILFTLSPRRAAEARRRWWVLSVAAGCVALAALWFIGLQVGVIGRLCTFCVAEHGIGLVLAFLVWVHAPLAPSGPKRGGVVKRFAAAIIALLAVGVLIGGQLLDRPDYTRSVVGSFDEGGGYTEPTGDGPVAALQNGDFKLDPGDHLLLGSEGADRFIVEAVDYTCPRCRALAGVLHGAIERLGPRYAVIVLPFPLNETCNRNLTYTADRHREACALAKLAYAVWLTDPAAYRPFHRWLFEHQEGMTRRRALDRAEELVDASRLGGSRVNRDVPRMLDRDIEVALRLGTRHLPGLFVKDTLFTGFPADSAELADAIRSAFKDRNEPRP